MSDSKPFEYYKSPDGEDVMRKLWIVLKPTAGVVLAASTADVLLYSKPKTYMKTIGRYAFIGGPIIAIASTFVITSNLVGGLRKKNDQYNWLVGGAAAGSIFGVWSRRPIVGFNMAVLFGLVAYVKRYCVDRGWDWIPPENLPVQNGGLWSVNHDWTYTKYRKGNWTSGKD